MHLYEISTVNETLLLRAESERLKQQLALLIDERADLHLRLDAESAERPRQRQSSCSRRTSHHQDSDFSIASRMTTRMKTSTVIKSGSTTHFSQRG